MSKTINENLIFDIGFHKGEDTKYYLEQGYKVVAVDAHPLLIEKGVEKFKKYVDSGQLILLNKGIAYETGVLDFWVNERYTEWSSFDKSMGCRDNTKCYKLEIECTKTSNLIEEYGLPHYIKVDIEGFDVHVIDTLTKGEIPKYFSCEAIHVELLYKLRDLGYTQFKMINQADRFNEIIISRETSMYHRIKRFFVNGVMNRTSDFIDWKFPIKSSGPFGEGTKGNWKSVDEVAALFNTFYPPEGSPLNHKSWFDFHATF